MAKIAKELQQLLVQHAFMDQKAPVHGRKKSTLYRWQDQVKGVFTSVFPVLPLTQISSDHSDCTVYTEEAAQ